jgi:hypothetical protein
MGDTTLIFDVKPQPKLDPDTGAERSTQEIIVSMDKQLNQLLECYYLGDIIQSQRFQNYILDRLVELFKLRRSVRKPLSGPKYLVAHKCSEINNIYDRTSDKSTLRKLLVAHHLAHYLRVSKLNKPRGPLAVKQLLESGCHEYIEEMLLRSLKTDETKRLNDIEVWDQEPCNFHSHTGVTAS